MLKTIQYRLKPTKTQACQLASKLEAYRWLYNQCLAERQNAWAQRQESRSYHTQATTLPQLQQDHPCFFSKRTQHKLSAATQGTPERVKRRKLVLACRGSDDDGLQK
jgi:transposase